MTQNVGDIEYVIKADTAQLLRADKQVTSVTNNMDTGFNKADNSASKLSTTISKLSAAISVALIIEWGKKFLELADNMTQLQARIARLSTDASTAKETFQSLTQISSKTGASLSDTTKLWETLTSSLKEVGASNAQVLNLTDTLQKIGRIGGNSTEEMSNALRQFGQSIASGTVRAEEFNSILEQMPELARQIAAGMGISMGELRQRMLDGKLTAQDALNAIQDRTAVVNEEFNKLPRSLSQATGSLETSFAKLVSSINDATGASSAAVTVIDGLAKYIEFLGDSSTLTADKLWSLAGAISKLNPGYLGKLLADGLIGDEPPRQVDVLSEKIANLTGDLKELSGQAEKTAHVEIPQTDNNKGGKGGGGKSTKKQANEATESLARQQAALDRLNTGYAEGSLELAQYDAVVALGNKATNEQISKARQQAKAIWQVTTAIKNLAQAEQAKRFTDQEIATNKTTPDAVTGAVQDPVAQISLQEQQKLAALEQYQQMGVLSVQQYEDTKTAIQEQAANARKKIAVDEASAQTEAIGSILNSASQGFGSLASIIENASGKSSGAYIAMFAAAKAFAIAQSTLSLNTAIMQAMADPTALTPAQKFANYAAIASAGSSLLSNIASISMGGARYNGGPVDAGSMYRVGEKGKPEIFQASNGSQYMIPGDNGRVISNRDMQGSGSGGGSVVQHITFEINTTGGIDDATKAWIVKSMKQVALFQINDQANRPNGMIQPRRK